MSPVPFRSVRFRSVRSQGRARQRWSWLLALVVLAAAPVCGQVEEQDLDVDQPVISADIERLFQDATALFETADQANTIPLFTQVVDALLPLAGAGESAIDERLRASLLYRARAEFNFGDNAAAERDFETLLRLAAEFEIDRDQIAGRLAELFDRTRQRLIGYVEFLVVPDGAELWVQQRRFSPRQGPQPILTGSYVAEARKPGYLPSSLPFEVIAGETRTVEAALDRTSAVLVLRTRPTDATIVIDGVERGRTQGQADADFVPRGDAGAHPRADFSALLMIDELALGSRTVEVRKTGFRTFTTRVDVPELRDIPLEPILLQRESGTVLLSRLPADAEVLLDGKRVRPIVAGSGPAQLTLLPGSYQLQVTRGSFGVFETAVDVVDRESVDVTVELRPALVVLGVLGGDQVSADRLRSGLFDEFQLLGSWSLLDRAATAAPLLAELGLDAPRLRARSPGSAAAGANAPDWSAIQKTFYQRLPGSVYLLAVLSNDVMATEADLWIWPAPPGPSRPEVRSVVVEDREALKRLATAFVPSIGQRRPVIGADFLDSALAAGPVVARVRPGGPADQAGLLVGDQVTAVGGVPVFSTADLRREIATHEAGETVALETQTNGNLHRVELATGRSFVVADLADPDIVYSALTAALAAELQKVSDWPRWVLELNLAGIVLRSGDNEAAVERLRRIETTAVPTLDQSGLGRAQIDYWLGLALTRAGTRFRDPARDAFARAASSAEGRLEWDEGPWIAPRARARLERLGAGGGAP